MNAIFVWTLRDLVYVVVFLIVGIFLSWLLITEWIRLWRCKHDDGVREDRSCNAWCNKCGKNLGFIGNLKNRGNPE